MATTKNINAEKIQGNLGITSVSATTYYNLPTDVRVTGGTYSSGTAVFTNNTGGTFNVTGFATSDGFIPYSGANKDVDLGLNQLKADSLAISTTSTETVNAGEIVWSSIDGTFDMGLIGGVTLQVGQEMNIYGKAVGVIGDGDAVMFAGSQGDHLLISKADPSIINTNPEYFIGVSTQTFTNNQFGYVTVFGKVRGLDTSIYSGGTVLYYDSNPSADLGALTNIKPLAPYAKIEVAAVLDSHANQGVLMVRPHTMPMLNDIQDVSVINPQNLDILQKNNGVWENTNSPKFTSLSATTYYNLPIDVSVTGGTYSSGTATYTNNIGGTFNVTGFNTGTVTSVAAITLGTSGNDLSSTVANGTTTPVITLNVPNASDTARGVITTSSQNIAGTKTFTTGGRTTFSNSDSLQAKFQNGTSVMQIGSSGNIARVTSNGNISLVTNYPTNSNPSFYINTAGRSLFNTTTDNGVDTVQINGSIYATSFKKNGGTSSQFLKADGSIDSTTYVSSDRTLGINGTTYDLSANRSWDIPVVTANTFNNSTYDLTISTSNGSTYTSNLGLLVTDVKVTGGTYNINTGVVTFTNSTGGTFTVSGFSSGMTDTFVTGGTYNAGTATFTRSNNESFNVNGFNTGTVTGVNTGNGMDFSNFTTSGTITLGTPSNTTLSSTNAVTTNSHTHAFAPGGTTAQYITGAGTLVTFPTIPTVNDGTLSMATSGIATGSASFTANQSGNSTFTVNVPATDLSIGSSTSTVVRVDSSTGTDATLPVATSSLAGVLTATDWTTFNNKQAAISYLEYNTNDKTIWNNGQGDITTNTSFGDGALKATTSGSYSTGFGNNALLSNTSGQNNTAVGVDSIRSNTTGLQNVGVGSNALYSNTTGGYNTAVGLNALWSNTTTNYNTAIGNAAGQFTTSYASNNNGVGSVFIGASTRSLNNNDSNQIVIGYNAVGLGSNSVRLGNTSITGVTTSGTHTAAGYKTPSGTSSQFLKADGSVDSNTYTTNLGTVTSVAAITLGTSGTDLSSTVANGTTTPVITLNVPTASASNRGVLSATDWSTFNGKQTALNGTGFIKANGTTISYDNSTYYLASNPNGYTTNTGTVTGSGTVGYIPKFSTTTGLGDSVLRDNADGTVTINPTIGVSSMMIIDASTNNSSLVSHRMTGSNYYLTGMDSSQNYRINVYNAGSFVGAAMYIPKATTRVLINSVTDDGSNQLQVTGTAKISSTLTANSFVKIGGTSSQFLKADGSVDTNTYATTGSLSSYVPTSRTITINGTGYDLSANRSWSVGTVTSVAAITLGTSGNDLSSSVANGTTTPVITLNVPDASSTARGVITTGSQTIAGTKTFSSTIIGSINGNADTVDNLHASDFVRAYTTTNDNIDSDWGQSFKTFDPVPGGTPPISSPNLRTINIGENYSRRTQLAFDYAVNRAWFRRRQDSAWSSWSEFIHSDNISSYAVPSSRTITINGTTLDLSANRSWTVSATETDTLATVTSRGNTSTGDITVNGELLVKSAILNNQSNSVPVGTTGVFSRTLGSTTAAFFDYVVTSGANARAGSVMVVVNGSSIEYTETSTNDIGNTSALTFAAVLSSGNLVLNATSTSGTWAVKVLGRLL